MNTNENKFADATDKYDKVTRKGDKKKSATFIEREREVVVKGK